MKFVWNQPEMASILIINNRGGSGQANNSKVHKSVGKHDTYGSNYLWNIWRLTVSWSIYPQFISQFSDVCNQTEMAFFGYL